MEINKIPPAGKTALLGMSLDELTAVALALGMPRFAGKQLAEWIYVRRASDFAQMTNISQSNREKLSASYEIGRTPWSDVRCSVDGTKKYLFPVGGGRFVESVFIPDGDRATLCISSQIGCKMDCLFCMTGKQGWKGNLSAAEILNQIFSVEEADRLTNIVYMGMGEPLDNTDEVMCSLRALTEGWGVTWSPKRITVSTIGAKGLERFLAKSRCHLAVSLHTPFADERQELMPAEKAFPILQTLERIRAYDFSGQRRVSFEYIVFDGLNDDRRHADELASILKGIPCRINLIRFHRIPGVPLRTSNEKRIEAFRQRMEEHGYTCTIRASRGEDIFAACGMLSTAKQQNGRTEAAEG